MSVSNIMSFMIEGSRNIFHLKSFLSITIMKCAAYTGNEMVFMFEK